VDAQRWAEIKEIFCQAVELPIHERAALLDRASAGDAELRAEVDSLLRAHELAGNFLEAPAVELIVPDGTAEPCIERIGQRIGPYQLIGKLGEGGMGEVYRAVRADGQYDKQVAIKLVRFGWQSPALLERFRQERQILAALESPHIARLYDGGTTEDGVPYVVMELIEGQRIDQYCEEHHLGVNERLALFRDVCGAVQYAHQHLVIHRDIKPSNILVTKDGVPKLLDFGIARVFEPETDRAFGSDAARRETTRAVMMTPRYASPEQLLGETITTATDVYALGVVLYELLTRESPFPGGDAAPHELARLICEVQPLTPSAAAARSGTRARWPRARDLDNIVMKALRKEPARRYGTAAQFGDDIRRYLDGLTVGATPDSLAYRVGTFARRRAVGVAATALICAAATAAVLVDLSEARIAAANGRRAQQRFDDVHQLATSLVFELHDAIRELPGAVGARRLLVDRAVRYLDSLAEEANENPALQRDLADSLIRLGDVQGNPFNASLGDTAGAEKSYAKALELAAAVAVRDPDNSADALRLALALRSHANVLSMRERMEDARAEFIRSVSIAEAVVKRHPDDVAALKELAHGYDDLAGILGGNFNGATFSDRQQALATREKGLAVAKRLLALAPQEPSSHSIEIVEEVTLGDLLMLQGRYREAETNYDRGSDAMDELARTDKRQSTVERLVQVQDRLAAIDLWRKDVKSALDRYRRSFALASQLSNGDPTDVHALEILAIESANLADGLSLNENFVEARRHAAKAIEIIENLRRRDPKNAEYRMQNGVVIDNVAEVESRAGDFRAALKALRRSNGIYREEAQVDPRNLDARLHLASNLTKLGDALVRTGDSEGAKASLRESLQLLQAETLPDGNEDMRYILASAYTGLGKAEAALAGRAPRNVRNTQHWSVACEWYLRGEATWAHIAEPGMLSPSGFYNSVPEDLLSAKAYCAKSN
jgi:non-specific serine/threonine protein kinase/serine/threonine-protein kinase